MKKQAFSDAIAMRTAHRAGAGNVATSKANQKSRQLALATDYHATAGLQGSMHGTSATHSATSSHRLIRDEAEDPIIVSMRKTMLEWTFTKDGTLVDRHGVAVSGTTPSPATWYTTPNGPQTGTNAATWKDNTAPRSQHQFEVHSVEHRAIKKAKKPNGRVVAPNRADVEPTPTRRKQPTTAVAKAHATTGAVSAAFTVAQEMRQVKGLPKKASISRPPIGLFRPTQTTAFASLPSPPDTSPTLSAHTSTQHQAVHLARGPPVTGTPSNVQGRYQSSADGGSTAGNSSRSHHYSYPPAMRRLTSNKAAVQVCPRVTPTFHRPQQAPPQSDSSASVPLRWSLSSMTRMLPSPIQVYVDEAQSMTGTTVAVNSPSDISPMLAPCGYKEKDVFRMHGNGARDGAAVAEGTSVEANMPLF